MPVIIDPRRHDAVLFDLETDLGSTLAARLRDVGVGTAVVPADGAARAAADLKV
ncbi:trehalose phosphatase, partial [Mycobacterium intracellulare]|nr:trehalose phosphatase [Mycobacterium intracellulare]